MPRRPDPRRRVRPRRRCASTGRGSGPRSRSSRSLCYRRYARSEERTPYAFPTHFMLASRTLVLPHGLCIHDTCHGRCHQRTIRTCTRPTLARSYYRYMLLLFARFLISLLYYLSSLISSPSFPGEKRDTRPDFCRWCEGVLCPDVAAGHPMLAAKTTCSCESRRLVVS